MVSDKMVDRNYLLFNPRVNTAIGMMKWLASSYPNIRAHWLMIKNRLDLSTSLTQAEKLTLDRPALCQSIDGRVPCPTGKTKISHWGQVTELNPIEITIKTSERYQLLKLEDILEIKASGG